MTLQEFKIYALAKKQIEYHSFNPNAVYMCVDLANDYIVKVWRLKAIIGTDAKDFPEKLTQGMEFVKNTVDYLPNPGEIAVWNSRVGGGAGHIAVVLEKGLQTTFQSLDQNWSKPLFITLEKHPYTNVRGFIRKVASTQEPMIDTALTECLKQHTDLVNQLEAEKRKNDALTDQLQNKETINYSLRGDVAEKASALKTVREELNGFTETLATKLTTIADKSEIIGAVDRLISGETDYVKKVRNLEKAYALLESEKKIEIEALKKSIEELKAANEDQAKHISTLEVRLINLETGDVQTKTLFDIIKNLFERITKK